MSKQAPEPATFTDLYEAMQHRKTTPRRATPVEPAGEARPPQELPPAPVRPPDRSTEPRIEAPVQRRVERPKERHTFDVYKDQLRSLARIQMDIYDRTGKKPTLGELVQRALDTFIEEQSHGSTDRLTE